MGSGVDERAEYIPPPHLYRPTPPAPLHEALPYTRCPLRERVLYRLCLLPGLACVLLGLVACLPYENVGLGFLLAYVFLYCLVGGLAYGCVVRPGIAECLFFYGSLGLV